MELTKRIFLKKIAKLFDPVGFLAPFLIRSKVLSKEMWAGGLDWGNLFLGDLAIDELRHGTVSQKIYRKSKFRGVCA